MTSISPLRPFTNRIINPITRRFAGRVPGFAILSYVGRRSGKRYRTPINVFHRDGRYVFALTYGVRRSGSTTSRPPGPATSRNEAGPPASPSPN